MSILVTGSTGFIGSHLTDALIEKGEQVTALVRKTSDITALQQLGVKLVFGDLSDPDSVKRAVKGSDIILHLATAPDWKPPQEQWRTNYCGTLNVFNTALKQGVQRFVHCSTSGVLGFADEVSLDENSAYSPSPHSPYTITKCEIEKKALTYFRQGLPVSILRPAQVYGPRDSGTMGLAFKWIQRGFVPLIGGGKARLQPIYVQDIVEAILSVMEKDEAIGQIYNIAGNEILTFNEFFSIITNAFSTDSLELNLPTWIAWVLGYLCELKTRLIRGPVILTRFRVECASKNMIYNNSKIRDELGFIPKVSVEEGVKRTVEWYLHTGQVKTVTHSN